MDEGTRFEPDPLGSIPQEIIVDLRRRYAEPQRVYHTWRHVKELLAHYVEIRSELRAADAVLLAILFHDAVYDPTRSDNEDLSAELLQSTREAASESVVLAARLIKATKDHKIAADLPAKDVEDAALFLDMDIAILGAPRGRFIEYEKQIRAEYAHVPDEAFRAGRLKILRRFIDRRPLFLSEWGRCNFAERAYENMKDAMKKLANAD
jgi:predicted metal-dependent HD superfamily phosphohydrolase